MTSQEPAFIGGWAEAHDKESGRTYYFNQKHETTWEKPRARIAAEKAIGGDAGQQRGSWRKVLDSSSGKYYYANADTGQTTWDCPEALNLDDVASLPSVRLASISIDEEKTSGMEHQARSLGHDKDGVIYDKIWIEEKELFYYYNRATEFSQWDEPAGWTLLDAASVGSKAHVNEKTDTKSSKSKKNVKRVSSPRAEYSFNYGKQRITVDDIGLPSDILEQILSFRDEAFVDIFFIRQRKRVGVSRKDMTAAEMLSCSTESISKPLLKSVTKDANTAFALFKLVSKCMLLMEDKTKKPAQYEDEIGSLCTNKPQLIDELFCQIVKQLTNNRNKDSLIRGWILFIRCICAFVPSKDMRLFLYSFTHKSCASAANSVKGYTVFALWRLHRTYNYGPMRHPLGMVEIEDIGKYDIPFQYISFGASLKMLVKAEHKEGMSGCVPKILRDLIKQCRQCDAVTTVGIFRRTGERPRVESLIDQIEHGRFELKETDPLVVTDVLKIWFREMSPRLFSADITARVLKDGDKPEHIDSIVFSLPEVHQAVLDCLLEFCVEVSRHKANNMSPDNLAIVWAPNLFNEASNDPSELLRGNQTKVAFVSHLIQAWQCKIPK